MRICVHPAGKGGVSFYRVRQPYAKISDKCEVFIYDPDNHSPQRLNDEQEAANILVFQMGFGTAVQDVVAAQKGGDKKVVMEFDDYIFEVNPMNPAYRTFGTKEYNLTYMDDKSAKRAIAEIERNPEDKRTYIQHKNGHVEVEMWKDGCNGFDLQANLTRASATKWSIANCDLVTVTTPELGKLFRKHRPSGPIAVLPNLVDFERWLPMKKNEDKEIRIGWQGGSAHYHDIHLVSKVLNRILKERPNVKLVMKGSYYPSLFEDVKDQVEWLAWHGDIDTYPLDVLDMKLDIGICPVIDDPFNRGKSDIKWVEYSAMKIPAVVSPVCYKNVKHGKTGFVASNGNEWYQYLTKLLDDKELRKEIAEKAYTRAKGYHNADIQSQAWFSALTDMRMGVMKTIKHPKKELVRG